MSNPSRTPSSEKKYVQYGDGVYGPFESEKQVANFVKNQGWTDYNICATESEAWDLAHELGEEG